MAHVNTVLKSFNLPGETLCLDLFRRPDGSFGFDTFRRDPEDPRGWYPVGHLGDQRFDTMDRALSAARKQVEWLADLT